MDMHVPQTEEARTEALLLMGVLSNLITPRNGEIVVSATQDFLTGAYKLSIQSAFFTRDQFCRLVTYMADALEHVDIPPPAIIKPVGLATPPPTLTYMYHARHAGSAHYTCFGHYTCFAHYTWSLYLLCSLCSLYLLCSRCSLYTHYTHYTHYCTGGALDR